MYYVTESYTFEESIKKSRFISVIFPCTSDQIEYALKKVNGQIIEQVFAGQIHLTVILPAEKQDELESQFSLVAR